MSSLKSKAAAAAIVAGCLVAAFFALGRANDDGAGAAMPQSDRISMADFKRLMANDRVVIVDVRSAQSYANGHIPGALSIPEETLNAEVAAKLILLGKRVVTYCA